MKQLPHPPFFRLGPAKPVSPVVLSVPHAGRDYSAAVAAAARLPLEMLESLEDRLVDRLIWRARAAGATAFVARAPRVEIDLNRDEREIEPALIAPPLPSSSVIQSARTRGGLGLIPSRIAGAGPIWSSPIPREELRRRIETIHRPYHAALDAALEEARARFGTAVLLDCHSMPPRLKREKQGEVVFGDRHGTTIAPDLAEAAVAAAQALGFRTGRNAPYAGGYIAGRHGRPERNVHAIQLEIDRSVYLAPDLRSPGPGFERAARLIAAVAQALADNILDAPESIAAE